MRYRVRLRACCPTRYQLLDLSASNEESARRAAVKHCNGGHRLPWKTWKVISVMEFGKETENR